MPSLSLPVLLVLLLAVFSTCSLGSVIGIDFGTQWMKVAIVKHGMPLDIVLNKESKRKTDSIVAIRGNERNFGADAARLAIRFPSNTYPSLKDILGQLYDSDRCAAYRKLHDNGMIKDPRRGTPIFKHDDNSTFSVKELVAMQLINAKNQAEVAGKEPVAGAVITIPPFFNQYERQALLDAAELAGLRVLSLIHDETAVAINYAMRRSFNTSQHHIFYDMGAGSTVAALISFKTNSEKDKWGTLKSFTSFSVSAVGYDRSLGGHQFDLRLQEHLANRFMEAYGSKLKSPVWESKRAMAKLLKEAERVKRVLSVNLDVTASVEGLHEDHDFRLKITREEFENMCADLFPKVKAPVDDILKTSGLDLKNVSSVIFFGGGVRVPKVEAVLKELAVGDLIAKNVNGDEAAALGAAFRAAGLTPSFRAKELQIKDITPYTISVDYQTEPKPGKETESRKTKIFAKNTPMDVQKYITFKRVTDFDIELKYSDLPESELSSFGPIDICKVSLSGLTASVKSFEEKEDIEIVGQPSVRVTMELSSSGLLNVTAAEAILESKAKEDESLKDKLLNLVGMGKSSNDEGEGEVEMAGGLPTEGSSATTTPSNTSFSESMKTETNNSTETAAAENITTHTTPPKNQAKTERMPLAFKIKFVGVKPMSDKEKKAAADRFKEWDAADHQRKLRADALNSLESYVYSSKELLLEDVVEEVTTEEQRETLNRKLSENSDWIYQDADSAIIEDFTKRLEELRTLRDAVEIRVKEHNVRPAAAKSLRERIDLATSWIEKTLKSWDERTDEERVVSREEVTKLETLLTETSKWLEEKMKDQDNTPKWAMPVVKTEDIILKEAQVTSELELLSKRKPKPKSKPKIPNEGKKNDTETGGQTTQVDEEGTKSPPVEEIPVDADSESVGKKPSEAGKKEDTEENKSDAHEEL